VGSPGGGCCNILHTVTCLQGRRQTKSEGGNGKNDRKIAKKTEI